MLRLTARQHVAKAIRRASTAPKPPPPPPKYVKSPPVQQLKVAEPQPVEPGPIFKEQPTFARSRALPWVLMSITGLVIGGYSTILFLEAWKPLKDPEIANISKQRDVSGRYEDTADSYDSEVGFSEVLMGVNRLRKRLAIRCTGHVLEASCGTGRNLGYFDVGQEGRVESLTFVDLSPQMVGICKKKWQALFGSNNEKLKPGLQVRFLTGSAIEKLPPAPVKEKYDTIIQTMGVCSTPSPVDLLNNLARHLDTSNPNARILLLEHGRSYREWLNRILDNAAEKHADIHGCWFNRDVGALVEDAAKQFGLEVINERRHHLGTTWLFELKPTAAAVSGSTGADELPPPTTTTRTWRSWLGLT